MEKFPRFATPEPASEIPEHFDPTESPKFSRRDLLQALVAVGAITAAGAGRAGEVIAGNEGVETDTEALDEASIDEAIALMAHEFVHYEQLAEEYRAAYTRELPHALPYALKETVGDAEGRSRLEYIETAFSLAGFDPYARRVLSRHLAAKAFVESGFNADAESQVGARGVLQMMEETFAEHARTPDANIQSLVEQVHAADNLLEQVRQTFDNRCREAFDGILAYWFAGDQRRFTEEFYIPCILSAYHAGATRVAEVINAFAQHFLDPDRIVAMEASGIGNERYDVFFAMTHLVGTLKLVPGYGPDSQAYVPKILAAREVLDAAREDGELMAALGAAREDTEG
jgi:hypothetical protein